MFHSIPLRAVPQSFSARNRLLAALAPHDLARVYPHLELVALVMGEAPTEPGRPIMHVLFPETGIVSVLATSADERHRVEVGLIGRDGIVGLPVVLGANVDMHETLVQADGQAWRLPSGELRRAMAECPALHGALLRYVQSFLAQTGHTALANACHRLNERVARWLLMYHDRLDGDELPLSQTFLSRMLGANRPGVTLVVHALEDAGLVRHERGRFTVLDRKGLEATEGGSYGAPEAEYARLFGSMRRPPSCPVV